ncbi:ABC transporter substrate-binding protein [Kosmotoga pacifica]|uniref:Branched-chain amino acid ABC transporter substrate-binding protein n=1 Tax=Kosmotoga pacifica TaxID=1330330 RepID=A0A0G2Z818_9BACT|nr:ABC transporter substrate-binding protein [Kosmotoga pacifica]AKI97707.1 branched-chain amino acid ABC transporter substrate-binding protein [Kosmotoga pacifica]
MKKVLVLFILLLSVLSLATVKIGVVLPMTGGIAAFGRMVWEGVEIAHELFPEVNGEPIELTIFDNRSDKIEAANAVRRAIEVGNVNAILGEVASSYSLSGGAVAEEKKTPMVSPASTNPLVTSGKEYVSRVCFIDPFQGWAAAVLAHDKLGIRNVAIFMDVEQDYAVGLANYFMETFQGLGGHVFFEYYKSGDQDFTAQISDAMMTGAEAFFIPGYYQEIALIAIQARQLGFFGPLITGDGADAPETITIGREAVNGLYFTTHYHSDSPVFTENAKLFLEKYREKYGKNPAALSALGFDAYLVIRDAIARAGSLDRDAIAQAIRRTKNFAGATGIINIDENGNAIKSVAIVKIEDEQFKYDTTINPQ